MMVIALAVFCALLACALNCVWLFLPGLLVVLWYVGEVVGSLTKGGVSRD